MAVLTSTSKQTKNLGNKKTSNKIQTIKYEVFVFYYINSPFWLTPTKIMFSKILGLIYTQWYKNVNIIKKNNIHVKLIAFQLP